MKFLKALAALFSKEVIEERVARVKTDPRVSEPVFMMIRSMKKRPHDWRVQLQTRISYDEAVRARHPLNAGNTIRVLITDRGVGECYEAVLCAGTGVVTELMYMQATKRVLQPEYIEQLCCATPTCTPEWLNPREVLELYAALSLVMVQRINRVSRRQNRETNRTRARNEAKQLRDQALERQRLITLYGEHKDE